jgi:hypothetical protein
MALPSSQPVTWLVCEGTGRPRPSGVREPLRAPQLPGPRSSPPASPHQVPGVAGALSSLRVPAASLEGQHHVPALVRVKHGVSRRDVDVEELGGAAWCFHTHHVREHVVAWGMGCKPVGKPSCPALPWARVAFKNSPEPKNRASSATSSVA